MTWWRKSSPTASSPMVSFTEATPSPTPTLDYSLDSAEELMEAVRPMVLMLKTLDMKKLMEEQGEDGSVPVRIAMRTIAKIIWSYDRVRSEI